MSSHLMSGSGLFFRGGYIEVLYKVRTFFAWDIHQPQSFSCISHTIWSHLVKTLQHLYLLATSMNSFVSWFLLFLCPKPQEEACRGCINPHVLIKCTTLRTALWQKCTRTKKPAIKSSCISIFCFLFLRIFHKQLQTYLKNIQSFSGF